MGTRRQGTTGLQLEALCVDELALVGQDDVGVQGTAFRLPRSILNVGIAGAGDGRSPHSRLAAHFLGVLAVLALEGYASGLVLQDKGCCVRR